jgi:ABC-type multidrug transport system fused ATPase/permease subunit
LGSCEASNLLGAIRFDNVHFRYQTADSCVLQDFCLEVHPGQTVALVGLSGAGKSTVFKLLQRFYEPQQGVIRLDDVPIEKFSLDSLRQQIAVVNQDVVIFSRSIRDNIAYGRTAVDEEAIIEVAKRAHAWEFIKDLPEGLDTMLGAKGLTLSGGQKQRIAIARAMLCARPVLLLDEATSALDAESEKWVQEGLHSLMATATTLVIAHRLSTVRHADLILVMDHGRVVEQGSHDELLKMNGAYARLHALQFNSEICQS